MSIFTTIAVSEFMSSPVRCVSPSDSATLAYQQIYQNATSCLAVVEDTKLVGVISRTDLLRIGRSQNATSNQVDARQILLDFPPISVGEIMTKNPATIPVNASIVQAATLMVESHIHRVFISENGQLAGVLSTLDVMRALAKEESKANIEEYMSSPVLVVDVEDTVAKATDALSTSGVSGLIVVEDNWPIGVFTQVEALAAKHLSSDTSVEEAMDSALICMPTTTSMQRAAKQAIRMRVRRIVASESRHMRGVLSGLDFARYIATE